VEERKVAIVWYRRRQDKRRNFGKASTSSEDDVVWVVTHKRRLFGYEEAVRSLWKGNHLEILLFAGDRERKQREQSFGRESKQASSAALLCFALLQGWMFFGVRFVENLRRCIVKETMLSFVGHVTPACTAITLLSLDTHAPCFAAHAMLPRAFELPVAVLLLSHVCVPSARPLFAMVLQLLTTYVVTSTTTTTTR
jgi:hypothetical protein